MRIKLLKALLAVLNALNHASARVFNLSNVAALATEDYLIAARKNANSARLMAAVDEANAANERLKAARQAFVAEDDDINVFIVHG